MLPGLHKLQCNFITMALFIGAFLVLFALVSQATASAINPVSNEWQENCSSSSSSHDSAQPCWGNRLAVRHGHDGGRAAAALDPQTPCLQSSPTTFKLEARYRDGASEPVPVKIIDVLTVQKVGYSILSSCVACRGIGEYNTLENGTLSAVSPSSPYLRSVSLSLGEGESPSFISTQFPPRPHSGYCFLTDPADSEGSLILGVDGRFDLWSLCSNSTAGGRVDVVWAARADHPHYVKSNCTQVNLTLPKL